MEPPVQSLPATRYRLRPGFHLLPLDGEHLLFRPDGRFARLRLRSELAEAVTAVLAAETPPSNGATEDELLGLLDRLVTEGVAEAVPEPSVDDRARVTGRVTIEGDGEVARLLVDLLLVEGLNPRLTEAQPESADTYREDIAKALGDSSLGETDIFVACAGWLPDSRFQAQDRWCFENGVARHCYYAEGDRFHIGPFWLPEDPRTVRYEDARARRLAAAVHADGLEAYWRHVEAGQRVNPPVPPSSAEAALIAGALAADILARSVGSTPPSHGVQLAYERSTGDWRRHPILPVPRGLMTEKMP